MTITSPAAVAAADPTQLPGSFLSCYGITNPREAMKAHSKNHGSNVLGDLWQDYDRFCDHY